MKSVEFEEIFESNSDLIWDYDFLSSCNYLTYKLVRNNLNRPWNLKKISRNNNITIDDIIDSPFIRWDWKELTLNESMTFEIIKDNPMHPWNTDILKEKLTDEQLQEFYNIRESS